MNKEKPNLPRPTRTISFPAGDQSWKVASQIGAELSVSVSAVFRMALLHYASAYHDRKAFRSRFFEDLEVAHMEKVRNESLELYTGARPSSPYYDIDPHTGENLTNASRSERVIDDGGGE